MQFYDLEQGITSDIDEAIRWAFQHNDLPTDTDEFVSDQIGTYLDSTLIYTYDIRELWCDMGCPEPEEMMSTISDSITYAVYGAAREELHDIAYDAVIDALERIREDIQSREITGTRTDDDYDPGELDAAEGTTDLLAAITEWRGTHYI